MDPKDPARNNGPLTVLDHLNQVSRQLVKSGFKIIGDTCIYSFGIKAEA